MTTLMWLVLLLVLVVILLGYHVYRTGAQSTTAAAVALVGTIVAAVLAFVQSFTVHP